MRINPLQSAEQTMLASLVVPIGTPVCAGTTLGGEGDPEVVRELRVPSFELVLETPAVELSKEVTRGVASARMREADPEWLAFVLSETLPVVPTKLVNKILKGEYVDMTKLLKDNKESESKRCSSEPESIQGHMGQASCRREVPDPMSWLQCFNLCATVVCSKYPEKAREI